MSRVCSKSAGINKIAQKVGEEAVELVIEAKDDDIEAFKGEAADLLFQLSGAFTCEGRLDQRHFEFVENASAITTSPLLRFELSMNAVSRSTCNPRSRPGYARQLGSC